LDILTVVRNKHIAEKFRDYFNDILLIKNK